MQLLTRRLRLCLGAVCCALALLGGALPAHAAGGPIVLMGIDAEDGGPNGHGPIGTYANLTRSVYNAANNGGTGILVVGGGKSAFDSPTRFWNAISSLTGFPVTYVNGAAISSAPFSSFRMIAVTSDYLNTGNGLTSYENSLIGARGQDVADFVNGGGGLLGFSSASFGAGAYPYLGALGSFSFSQSFHSNIDPTPDGLAAGVDNSLDVCCWHDVFTSFPNFLVPLAYRAGSGQAVAIGGLNVVLPGAINLDPSSAFRRTGVTHTSTATVRDQNGAPIGGAAIQFTVLSGPNAGLSAGATSNGAGQASFSWTSAAQGVDVLQAQFVDATGTLRKITAQTYWDDTAPTCSVSQVNATRYQVTFSDGLSGLAQIQVLASSNFSVTVPGFVAGASPVVVTADLINSSQPASFSIRGTDRSGNQDTCNFSTNVPPVAVAQNVTVAADAGACSAQVTAAQVNNGSSDADGDAITLSLSPAGPYPVGLTTVTLTATDPSGTSSSATAVVKVEDREKPQVSCPADVTQNTDSGLCTADVTTGAATATDNCPGVQVTSARSDVKPLADPYPVGATTITWTATDAAGNSSTCSQTVTVTDAEKPQINCPADVTANNDPGKCDADVDPGQATASDNCAVASISGSRSDTKALGAPYPVGATTITWTATDAAGNSSTCSQTVTVNDVEKPQIACPADVTANNDPGKCDASAGSVGAGQATATDNCQVAGISGARSDGKPLTDPYPVGVTTVTWTATDNSANSATCTQTITVKDVEAPVISGASVNPSVLWPPNHKMVDVIVNYTDTDNCGAVQSTLSVTSNEPSNGLGDGNTNADWEIVNNHLVRLRAERSGTGTGRIYTITITSVDQYGNTSTASVTVTVPHSQGGGKGK